MHREPTDGPKRYPKIQFWIFGHFWSNLAQLWGPVSPKVFHGGKNFKAKNDKARSELSEYAPKSCPRGSFDRFWSDFRSGVEGNFFQKSAEKSVKLTRYSFASFSYLLKIITNEQNIQFLFQLLFFTLGSNQT